MNSGKLFLTAAAILLCCGLARECADDEAREPEYERTPLVDTLVYVDTVRYYMPVARERAVIRYVTVGLPLSETGAGEVRAPGHKAEGVFSPDDKPAGANVADYGKTASHIPDSAAVEIPITQREYESEEYHAWVSGYEARLDSIAVFSRREVVTIREPSLCKGHSEKRWGVGLFAGYGVTPQGLQPCAGISINYNLWNF